MSFSSQLSLFNDLPKHDLSRHTPFRAFVANTRHDKDEARNSSKDHHHKSTFIPESRNEESPVPEMDGNASIDLDETLKFSPSLAKGVEFNDEEAWESFNHGSPHSRHRAGSSGSDLTVQSPSSQGSVWKSPLRQSGGAWKLPVKKELLEGNIAPLQQDTINVLHGRVTSEGGSHIAAVEKSRVTAPSRTDSGTEMSADIPAESTRFADYQHSVKSDSPESLYDSLPPPPPSALVSRLFPALRQVDEQPKGLFRNGQVRPCHTSVEEDALPTKSPSPISSMEGDSGIRSLSSTSVALSEDMKYKLNQLEEEIAKYRSENACLEKLRKEREEVRCTCVLITL